MTGKICYYANENGYCDSTACHNMNVVGNIIPKERPENIGDSSIWVKPHGNWHTGTPTEDGEYLVICQYVINNYYYREKLVWEFENGNWKNKQRLTENNYIEELKILAWYGQKIEPYIEATE